MQTFSIPYYKDHVTLNVPDENLKAAIYPKAESYQAALPEVELVCEALEHPIGSEKLCELAKGKKKITIVTSDHTRPVPSKITLPILLAELRKGNPEAEITILIATGLHRETTQAEQRQMFVDEERIVVNNAFRKEDFDFVCKLPSDAELWVNREALTCDLLITEGFIEPHFFAGFSGGRKSILPGVSGLQTIRHNHAYSLDPKALRSNPKIGNGVLTGNPLHEDMCEAAAMLPHLFMVNLVMNAQMQLHAIFSGHYLKSWEAGCALVNKIYQVDVPEQADVIVASCGGFPKDISLYQGTKTVDNVEPGLKPGGTLILMLEAPEGGGPEEYFGWCQNLLDGTIEKRLREAFTVAGYIFFQNCEQAQRQKILLYSSIPDELVRPMGMRSFSDMGALLKEADLAGKSIYVIPNGATVVPHVCKEAVL